MPCFKLIGAVSFALTMLALSACGSDRGDTGTGLDGGSGGTAGADGNSGSGNAGEGGTPTGGDATTGSTGGSSGDASVTCSDTQARCRGACFDKVGEVKNGCELMARTTGEVVLASDAKAPGALVGILRPDRKLVSIRTTDFVQSVLDEDVWDETIYGVLDGFVYYSREMGSVRRVPLAGGADEEILLLLTGYYIDRAIPYGAYLYFATNYGGVSRVPLVGGAQENLFRESIDTFTIDADTIYTNSGLPNRVLSRPLATPAKASVLTSTGNGDSSTLFAFPSQPLQLLWYAHEFDGDSVLTISRTGGNVSKLYQFGISADGGNSLVTTGTSLVYAHANGTGQNGLDTLSLDGTKRTAIDSDDSSGTVAEDAKHFYLSRYKAIFRIAKSGL